MLNIDMVLEGDREKVKAEVNEYLYALKYTHHIDWFARSQLNDLVMPLLDKCYDLMNCSGK